MKYLPMKLPVMEHGHERAVLPQWYSDQFGWEEIVAETAQAWNRLSPAERGDCGIFAQDYGQAGAIDFLGRRYGLPPALSGHQTYFLWGPRGYSGNCMIVLDDNKETLEKLWENVEYVGTSADNPYALERKIDVFICKGRKIRHARATMAWAEAMALMGTRLAISQTPITRIDQLPIAEKLPAPYFWSLPVTILVHCGGHCAVRAKSFGTKVPQDDAQTMCLVS